MASIRGKILLAFFVIVGVSFFVAATNLSGLVRGYMFDQRKREDTVLTERAAETAAHSFFTVSAEDVGRILAENADAMNGRLMLIDMDGKVQYDTFQTLCGSRLQIEEVLQVLTGGEKEAYGMYQPGRAVAEAMSGEEGSDHVAYCACEMTEHGERIGAMLFVSRVQRMMDSLNTVQWQLISVFLVIAVAALVLALVLSQVLTKPITALSKTMSKMGKGDLSVRVPVRGSGELKELAENYNTMASQLERLDESRNQFVSNASHELKTPLATMKIMLETMLYQPDMPPEIREDFMTDMNHEIDRLTGIITDLLTLTRMDSGSENLRKETVDMSRLTEETVRSLMPAADQKNQKLTAEVEQGISMRGDRLRLNQILYNLTDNAIKYTPEGGEILVTLRKEEDDSLLWAVRDNGIGIPKEDQERIFDRFYRVDKARGRDSGGTGLGLSIVRQLIGMYGGTISVQSEMGKGTEFTVRLPGEGAEK